MDENDCGEHYICSVYTPFVWMDGVGYICGSHMSTFQCYLDTSGIELTQLLWLSVHMCMCIEQESKNFPRSLEGELRRKRQWTVLCAASLAHACGSANTLGGLNLT